ncbi:MAG: hypothetical protein B9S38_09440 [Verrucomicrobiia bacterium Tous-C4TDCM]|nr:MAG: hypothetical protein B9S38_09440 [Verrucomicrobiae bacterium Tous-C4TDCM]
MEAPSLAKFRSIPLRNPPQKRHLSALPIPLPLSYISIMRIPLISLLLALPLAAADLDFKEAFADPATREVALARLVPKTRDWFFHHALHHQLAGRADAFRQTLADWKAAADAKDSGISLDGYQTLETRELLRRYEADPQKSIDALVRLLDLKFDDSRPDAQADQKLPDRLDPALVVAAAFEKAAASRSDNKAYRGYSQARLLAELDRLETFDEAKLRYFHDTLQRADHPQVVPLIARALTLDQPPLFGSSALHRQLTREQLDALQAAVVLLRANGNKPPINLLTNESFATRYFETLRPGSETDFALDLPAHAAHLAACRELVVTRKLGDPSLAGHVLFHHLRLQRELGQFPLDDFLAYLALPRERHPLLLLKNLPQGQVIFNTTRSFNSATGCGPVGDDQALIEAYLQHFLATADTPDAFKPYFEEKTLRRLHARAQLLAGADPVRWGAELDPAEVLELQKETRIAFAPGQPVLLPADAAVKLALDLKNTPQLLVRIFELDLPAWIEREGSEPPVDLDLDGLVPHHEKRLTFAQPPVVLHRESLDLPELAGPGAWIVECVSRGVATRALIRKGRLIPYVERTARGQSVRVFSAAGALLKDAEVALGSEVFKPDPTGRILIPDRDAAARQEGLVRHGKLAVPLSLDPRTDDIAFNARFHLDREQLLADRPANLFLRLQLASHGHELPLEWIEKPSLTLVATLVGGLNTERVIGSDLKLAPQMFVPFQVPADALALKLRLTGTVTPRDGADPIALRAEQDYAMNGILNTGRIGAAYFTRDSDGHRLELRGRNGEPLANRPLSFDFTHRDHAETIPLALRSDARGIVALGKLADITEVHVRGSDISHAGYFPDEEGGWSDLPDHLHLAANEEIRLPLVRFIAAPDRTRLSLLEWRGNTLLRDHFDKLAVENRSLVLRGLPPGDFTLSLDGKDLAIRVSSGPDRDGLLVSATRILPRHAPALPFIAAATLEADSVVVRVEGASRGTRVSLLGGRYLHSWDAGEALQPLAPPQPDLLEPGFTGNGYLEDRRLGDEMRYILDRRAAKTFPGSLLPRPGLLVNRWSQDELSQSKQLGGDGSEGEGLGSGKTYLQDGPIVTRPDTRPSGEDGGPSLDFLAASSVLRYDLEVGANGQVRVPAADFATCQFIDIVAADPAGRHHLVLPLAPNDTPLRDRRLARPLDAAKHHVGTRRAAALAQGAEAAIESVIDADWRAFTTLAEAHQFLFGATGDARLNDFLPLLDWPSLDEPAKLAFLSEHACHELHLFLARKDAVFFENHVKPMLAEKREPTVIDDILLGRDLLKHLRPFAWQRLNAAEKALLAQAMPEARVRVATELKQRWDLEAPTPEQETLLFTQTLRGTDLATEDSLGLARNRMEEGSDLAGGMRGNTYMVNKLKSIIIPEIDFEDITVEEAIDFLRMRSIELDTMELDPAKKGINFVIRRPRGGATGELGAARDVGSLRIKELRLRNVPISEALAYITGASILRYSIDDYAVTLVPATETDEDLMTRVFRVPPDFIAKIGGSYNGEDGGDDPFAEGPSDPATPTTHKSEMELLKENGIKFPEGASVRFNPGSNTLIVRNTPTNLEMIEQITTSYVGSSDSESESDPFAAGGGGGVTGGEDPFADLRGKMMGLDESESIVGAFNSPAARPSWSSDRDQTRLWHESNYYKHRGATDETFIPLNRFWLDLATWDGKGGFLSPNFNACTSHANEALFCLAMLDLPFKAARPETKVDGSTLRVKAREPMLLFYKDTRETQKIAPDAPVLVRQTFHRLDDRFRTVEGRQIENSITGDFLAGVPYGASLVVTNPSGAGRRIDALAQIPAGAIPLYGLAATPSSTHELKPYGVLNLRLAFYFPAAGEFPLYPLQVSEGDLVLARTPVRTLRATAEAPPVDANSWPALARDGTADAVLDRLRNDNLATLDLKQIRWRLRDAGFFRKAIAILRERLFYSPDVASFGFVHDSLPAVRDYLENEMYAAGPDDDLPPPPDSMQLGDWLDSPLLEIRPVTHRGWETLEFDPLVNPRAHRFADKERLTHEEAAEHYEAFLDLLAWKPQLSADDRLALTAHLLMQDRVEEALARFDTIEPAALTGRLAYDYLNAVVLFHRAQPEDARAIATRRATLPPGLWKERFAAIVPQADEILALQVPRKPEDAKPKKEAPSLDLALAADGKLRITHRRIDKTLLQLFSVDLEVLFSKDPFLSGDSASLPGIRANETREVALQGAETAVELPEAFRQGNVLVAANSGSTRVLKVLDSKALEIVRQPAERTLQVFDSATRLPLPRSYVKVYTQGRDGEAVFHKDGYTDLRGKFDYLSHTGSTLGEIRRIAVLISHPEKGARIEIFDL